MTEWLARSDFGDPARLHHEGHVVRVAIETARDQVAALLGARNREVVFTSGATEAITTAIWGAAERGAHMVVPAIEHSAVRTAATVFGGEVTTVGCDRLGRVDASTVVDAIRDDTSLVHIQWGNHEVGTIQPVAEVVAACRERGVLVHVDAAQAAGRVPIAFGELGADLMSVSAHKMGGPTGVGALLIRRGVRLRPLLTGSDQERARRAGVENAVGIVGWGAACEALAASLDEEAARARRLRDRLIAASTSIDGVDPFGDWENGLPHIACLGIGGVEPQAVLLALDQHGISVHSGSACASEEIQPSPVLEAMGVEAARSLRLSLGWNSTDADVDAFVAAFGEIVGGLRALAGGPS